MTEGPPEKTGIGFLSKIFGRDRSGKTKDDLTIFLWYRSLHAGPNARQAKFNFKVKSGE